MGLNGNDVKTITIPGRGDVDFPSDWDDNKIQGSIQKNFPEFATQAKNRAQRLNAAFDSILAPTPEPQHPEVNVPSVLPGVKGAPSMLNMRPNTPAQQMEDTELRLRGNGQSLGTGAGPVVDNPASRFYKKYIHDPQYLAPAIDEAGQLVNAYLNPQSGLKVDPNNPVQHLGTQVIPKMLAPHGGGPNDLSDGDNRIQQAARGLGSAAYETAGGLTTPEMMGAALGFKVAPESLPAKLAGGAWSAEMLKAAPGQLESGVEKFRQGDFYGGTKDTASSAMSAGFGTLGAMHMVHESQARMQDDAQRNAPPVQEPVPTPAPAPTSEAPIEKATAQIKGLLPAPPTDFGAKLNAAVNSPKATPSAPTGVDAVASNLEQAVTSAPINRGTPETRVQAYEVANNLDRDSLAEDIRKKGTQASAPDRQFLIDYQRTKGQEAVAVPPPIRLKGAVAPETPGPVEAIAKPAEPIPAEPKPVEPAKPETPEVPTSPIATPGAAPFGVKPEEPVTPAKKAKKAEEPQAITPLVTPETTTPTGTAAEHESFMRPLVSKVVRIQQLAAAAKNRLNAEFALQQIRGTVMDTKGESEEVRQQQKQNLNPLANPDRSFQDLEPRRQEMVKAVAKVLGTTPDAIHENGWRLTDSQVKRLKDMRSEGLRPYDLSKLAPEHPELAFGKMVHQPLADINEANAAAAGIKNPKDLWAKLSPEDRAERKARQMQTQQAGSVKSEASPEDVMAQKEALGKLAKATGISVADLQDHENLDSGQMGLVRKAVTKDKALAEIVKKAFTVKAPERATAGVPTEGTSVESQVGARKKGTVEERGKNADDLLFEHDKMQKMLGKELKQAQSALAEHIPNWREARIAEKDASPLSTDIAALAKRTGIPKELYAQEHLTPDTDTTPKAAAQPESVPSAIATPEQPAPETPEAKLEPDFTKESETTMAHTGRMIDEISQTHGAKAEGALPQMWDAVTRKYKNPDLQVSAFDKVVAKFQEHLALGTEDPVKATLKDTLDKFKKETGKSSTLYSNPIGPLFDKLFRQQRPVVRDPIEATAQTLPSQPIQDLANDIAGREPATAAEKVQSYFSNEADKFMKAWWETPGSMQQRWREMDSFFTNLKRAMAERPGLSAVDFMMGSRNLDLTKASYEAQDFIDKMERAHPKASTRSAIIAWHEAGGGRLSDAEVQETLTNQMHDLAGSRFIHRQNNTYYKVFKEALALDDKAKATAADYRAYDQRLLQREAELGLNHAAQLDYFTHLWHPDNFTKTSLGALRSGAGFSTNAQFEKMRTFYSYFDGIQRGWKPNSLDMSYIVSSRAMSSARVIANRKLGDFLRGLDIPGGGKAAELTGQGQLFPADEMDPNDKGAILVTQGLPKSAVVPADPIKGTPERKYVIINHPAFQGWKWLGKASDGTPVMGKTDLAVHPDLAPQLQRLLEPSMLRAPSLFGMELGGHPINPIKPILGLSSAVKQTLLIGLFHPQQLALHLLEHAGVGMLPGKNFNSTSGAALRSMNPLSNEKFIDLNNPKQQLLVMHGLQLRLLDAESMADEGVMSRGLVKGAPFIGGAWGPIHDTIFTRMIPNMKMSMGMDILNRNMNRYNEKWTREEIVKAHGPDYANQPLTPEDWKRASLQAQSRVYRLTAEQTNAAFGGVDWSKMMVNKTMQDGLRLAFLAPDFLLSRVKFGLDAFRPGGAESRNALALGFAAQYVICRGLNAAMNDGDAKWDIHDWNKLVVDSRHAKIADEFIKGEASSMAGVPYSPDFSKLPAPGLDRHSYSFRTVQGDMIDSAPFIGNPRTFWEHRINPLWRPAFEAYTQTDTFGHPLHEDPIGNTGINFPTQQVIDTAKNSLPLPAQGLVDDFASKLDPSLRSAKNSESSLDTFVSSMTGVQRKRYRSPAEQIIYGHYDKLGKSTRPDDDLSLEQSATFNRLRDDIQEGKLQPGAIAAAIHDPNANLKLSEMKYLWKTAKETQLTRRARQLPFEDVYEAWKHYSVEPSEKLELTPILQSKIKTLAPEKQKDMQLKLNEFRKSLTPDQHKALQQHIREELDWENTPRDKR